MYKAKYTVRKTKNPDGRISGYSVILEAKFRFGEEVALINRLDVKRRTFFKYENYPIVKYLLEKEKLGYTNEEEKGFLVNKIFKDSNRIIKIKAIFGLGFDLKAKTTNKDIPLERIIDLDALNEFVLTGEA